jgi:hypothetical protein
MVADDRGDHEMDRIRAEVDRRADASMRRRGRRDLGRPIRAAQDGVESGALAVVPGPEGAAVVDAVRRLTVVRAPAGLVAVFRLDRFAAGLRQKVHWTFCLSLAPPAHGAAGGHGFQTVTTELIF